MKVNLQKVCHPVTRKETGTILTINLNKLPSIEEKLLIENHLQNFVHDNVYRGEGINVYSIKNSDSVGIIAMRKSGDLPVQEMDIDFLS